MGEPPTMSVLADEVGNLWAQGGVYVVATMGLLTIIGLFWAKVAKPMQDGQIQAAQSNAAAAASNAAAAADNRRAAEAHSSNLAVTDALMKQASMVLTASLAALQSNQCDQACNDRDRESPGGPKRN